MSFSKRVDEARRAYARRDLEASAKAHALDRIAHEAEEEHGGAGSKYIGDLVYGGLDGIITTFAVVSGVAGAKLGSGIVVILGLANLIADGLSMATGAFLSTRSEREYYQKELERERWEVENLPEAERAELHEIYLNRGYSEEEAGQLVVIQTRDHDRWVKAMMVDELGLLPDERTPWRSALATFVSFLVAGVLPLAVYLLGLVVPIGPESAFPASLALSGLALFGLGAAKVLITEQNAWRSGFEMLGVGGLAACVAYGIGVALKGLGT